MKYFLLVLAFLSADARATNFFDHVNASLFSVVKRDESSGATINALNTNNTYVKLTATVTTINGAAAPATPISKMLIISNQTGGTVTIAHASGSATTANRFALQGAADLAVLNGSTASFLYDHGQSRWIQFGGGGVTSVAISDGTLNSDLSISGSPITGSGTISIGWASKSARRFLGSPSVTGTPAFRAIDNADLPTMAQSTFKGRAAGAGTGIQTDLSATQATAILDAFVGDSGSGGTKGLVPAPATGDAAKFLRGDATWVTAGSGTVTSVNAQDSSGTPIFTVLGGPVTSSGMLSFGLNSQFANKIFAGPTSGGSPAEPAFRFLVGADLPNPSSSTLGGVQSIAATTSNWIRSISTSGVPALSQPAFTDISGTATVAQTTVATVALTTCSTARTVDWSTTRSFTLLLTNGSTCAITFSNPASGQSITIKYVQPASTGSALVSYASTVFWQGGTVPTMTTGGGKKDVCTYIYDGTDYVGTCVQDVH